MKRLSLAWLLLSSLLVPSSIFAQTLIVNYSGACSSYNYDVRKICFGSAWELVQCAQFGPTNFNQHTWGLTGVSSGDAHIQVWGHSCGLLNEEFLMFDGTVAVGQTASMNMTGPCPYIDDGSDAGNSCQKCCGMPVWSVSDYVSLWLHDEPLGYQPAAGPAISLKLGFKQREASAGLAPNTFSLGKKWNFSWFSYVSLDASGSNFVHFPDGRERTFAGSQDFLTNTRLTGNTNSGFTIQYPDGSKDVYGWIVSGGGGAFLQAFMSERWNANSQKTTF
jgi:hypothetical protein